MRDRRQDRSERVEAHSKSQRNENEKTSAIGSKQRNAGICAARTVIKISHLTLRVTNGILLSMSLRRSVVGGGHRPSTAASSTKPAQETAPDMRPKPTKSNPTEPNRTVPYPTQPRRSLTEHPPQDDVFRNQCCQSHTIKHPSTLIRSTPRTIPQDQPHSTRRREAQPRVTESEMIWTRTRTPLTRANMRGGRIHMLAPHIRGRDMNDGYCTICCDDRSLSG